MRMINFMNDLTIIVLGAGASKSDGAPMQDELVRVFYENINQGGIHDGFRDLLLEYFKKFWDIDRSNYTTRVLPSFEECIGILDLAYLRKDVIKNAQSSLIFDHHDVFDENLIDEIRVALKFLISYSITKRLYPFQAMPPNNHSTLIGNILKLQDEEIRKIVFISLNYDLLIDDALRGHFFRKFYVDFDYMWDINKGDWDTYTNINQKTEIPLFKLHGSLNWLYCPVCHSKYLTLNSSAYFIYMTPQDTQFQCRDCGNRLEPIIIPPTFYKDLSQDLLQKMYIELDTILRRTKNIFFCGYSFPDADLHVKYLFKRAEMYHNRENSNDKLNIQIFNQAPNDHKPEILSRQEKERYCRFFTHSNVSYRPQGFEYFCQNFLDLIE